MVAIIAFTASLLMGFLANASPILDARQDSSVLDFTLYQSPSPNQAQCFTSVGIVHIDPKSLDANGISACFPKNFLTVRIDKQHGKGCRVNVFDNASCSFGNIGSYTAENVCNHSDGQAGPLQLRSYQVSCDNV